MDDFDESVLESQRYRYRDSVVSYTTQGQSPRHIHDDPASVSLPMHDLPCTTSHAELDCDLANTRSQQSPEVTLHLRAAGQSTSCSLASSPRGTLQRTQQPLVVVDVVAIAGVASPISSSPAVPPTSHFSKQLSPLTKQELNEEGHGWVAPTGAASFGVPACCLLALILNKEC